MGQKREMLKRRNKMRYKYIIEIDTDTSVITPTRIKELLDCPEKMEIGQEVGN